MGSTILALAEDDQLPKKRLTKEKLIAHLVAVRNIAGLTQKVLANKLGKPQSFVSKYETGERKLDFIEVIAVFEALDRDPITEIKRLIA